MRIRDTRKAPLNMFCLGVLILFLYCPAFSSLVNQYFSGAFFYAVILLLAVLNTQDNTNTLTIDKRHSNRAFFVWLFLFYIVYNFFVHTNSVKQILGITLHVEVICAIQLLLLLPLVRFLQSDSKYDTLIIKLLLISLAIDLLFTTRAVTSNYNISKIMATGSVNASLGSAAFGVIGYAIVYAIVLAFPPLLLACTKWSGKKQALVLIVTVMILAILIRAAYVMALLLTVLEVLLLFLLTRSRRTRFVLLPFIVMFVVIIWNTGFITDMIVRVANMNLNPNITRRLTEIAHYLLEGEMGSSLLRLSMQTNMLEQFFRNPLFGQAVFDTTLDLSGHADILDMMASGGLLLTIPFLLFIYYNYRVVISRINDRQVRAAAQVSFIGYIVLGTVNTILRSSAATFMLIGVIPCLLRMTEQGISEANLSKKPPPKEMV